jgi:hypothetical protein
MEIPLPKPSEPDIYSYGFDKSLNKIVPEKKDNPSVYNSSNPINASNIVFGALNMGSGTSVFGVDPSKGLWLGAEKFENAPAKITMGGDATFNKISAGQYLKVVSPGENIQEAIDALSATGGKVFLKSGLYVVNYDIIIPSNVILEGNGMLVSVINFNSNNNSVKMIGSDQYSVGTVSITNGSMTLSSTTSSWLANITTNHSIKLENYWYDIASVVGDGTLILTQAYNGNNLVGDSYDSAILIDNAHIKNLMVVGSGTCGIFYNYTYNCFIENVLSVYNAGNGVHIKNSGYPFTKMNFSLQNGGDGIRFENVDHGILSNASFSNLNNGITFDNVTKSVLNPFECRGNAGDGININNSSGGWLVGHCNYNAGEGVEITSTNNLAISGFYENNASDGIKIASDSNYNILNLLYSLNNGGYGANIAAASNEYNLISSIITINNTSGTIQNLGSTTRIIW